MSFDLYFAGCSSNEYEIQKFLYSQYNDRSTIIKMHDTLVDSSVKTFLDSGAWTAYTKNANINIDEYINYINDNSSILNCVASLDVIPKVSTYTASSVAAEESWKNFLYMRKCITNPKLLIPVFHYPESFDNLVRILNYEDEFGPVDCIGIGGIAPIPSTSVRDSFLSKCFAVIQEYRKTIGVHAFGMTDLLLLERYPFTSADSTSWRKSAMMGEIITKFGRVVISKNRKNDGEYKLKSIHAQNTIKNYVSSFGFDFEELEINQDSRIRFNVMYLKNWENSRSHKQDFSISHRRLF